MTSGAHSKPAGAVDGMSLQKADLLRLLLEKNLRRSQEIRRLPRGPGSSRYPASSAQQSLWFIDRLESGQSGYHVQIAMRLRGSLDEAAVQAALDCLVERHETLRTVFPEVNGEPMQEVAPHGNLKLTIVDLSKLDEVQQEAQLRARASEDAGARFDLRAGPLARAMLIRLNADQSMLLLTLHHIVADGWSKSLLVREFATIYGLTRAAASQRLPALPIQYADYVGWQTAWLQRDDKAARQLAYWRTQLSDAPSQLELPTDRTRPAAPSLRGANCSVTIDAALTARVKSFAAAHRMTLSMVLHAAWAILLSRLSRQEDVLVGMPVANRQRPEVESLIGLFVNTLVLRVPVQPAMPLAGFLEQIKQHTLAAFNHQDVPFEQIVQALQVPRSLSFNPLFQVAFVVKNTPPAEIQPRGLELTLDELADEPTNLDLALFIEECGARIEATATYAIDLFEAATIEGWLDCYVALLEAFVEEKASARPLCELRILSASQRQRLSTFADSDSAEYPRNSPVHEVFEAHVLRNPDAIAAVDQCLGEVTYGALNAAANRLAHYLIERNVRPGDCVPVLMPRSFSLLLAQLAILKTGAAYLPLDPESPPDRQAFMVRDCGGHLLIAERDRADAFPQVKCVSLSDIEQNELPTRPTTNPSIPVDAGATAYVMYTSGSTGLPKGVAVAHRGVTRLVINTNYWQLRATDCVSHCSNPIFDASTLEIWGAWLNGARLLVVSPHDALDVDRLSDLIVSRGVTAMFLTTALLSQHSERLGAALRNVRYLVTGGDVADVRALRRVLNDAGHSLHLINGYGPTENCVITTTYLVERIDEGETSVPIGRPIANTQLYILDDRLSPVPIGGVGEIYSGGDGVALSYLNRPELTAERFVANPFSASASSRLYRTGDLGRWRPDGNVMFLGRADQQVKLRGLRVELGEIEAHLLKHSHVKEAAVWVHQDEQGEKRLVAHIVPRLDEPLGDEARQTYFDDDLAPRLREHLLQRVPQYMVPAAWALSERLPLTATGKIDRRKLAAPAKWTVMSGERVAPTTELEKVLAETWAEVLKVDRIGINENFFELGGHSLMGVKLLTRVRERVDAQLPTAAVFHYPTIQQMAEFIRSQSASVRLTKEMATAASNEPTLDAHPDLAPLTHTQLARWNSYQDGERRPMRTVSTAVRLSGQLDVPALQRALTEIVARHDALRTNIIVMDGEPVQRIAQPMEYAFSVEDLSNQPPDLQAQEIDRASAALVLGRVDLEKDRLFETRLLKLGSAEHVLILALEHIVSDGYSLAIVLREMLDRYSDAVDGAGSSLAVALQFSQYAKDQRRDHASWQARHEHYWHERLSHCGRSRFPVDAAASPLTQGWATVPLTLTPAQRCDLFKWCQEHRTTAALAALTAYVALILRWCATDQTTIQYLSDCRDTEAMAQAIGFFASPLYLCIRTDTQYTFRDLLARVTEEYCSVSEHVDLGFFESRTPRPDFTRSTSFNWVPQPARTAAGSGSLTVSVEPLAHTSLAELQLDQDPGILLYDMQEEINGVVHFPRERFSEASMMHFARSFVHLIELLQRQPDVRVAELRLPAAS